MPEGGRRGCDRGTVTGPHRLHFPGGEVSRLASLRQGRGSLPPPPVPSRDHAPTDVRPAFRPTKTVYLDRAALDPVRLAWRYDGLWDAPQESTSCLDGRVLVMEACVRGQYAVRVRNCRHGHAAEVLWRAVQAALPAPPPARD